MLYLSHTLPVSGSIFARNANLTDVLLISADGADDLARAILSSRRNTCDSTCGNPFVLHRANNLAQAFEVLNEPGVDVVILVVSRPGTAGLDPLPQLLERNPAIPVVIVSGIDDEAAACQAIRLGAQDYLSRQEITGKGLLRSLRYAIERHQLFRSASLTDDLTNLLNRKGFSTLAGQQLKLARSHRIESPLLLGFLDIDGLKQINDCFGHKAGSQAIRDAADILRETFRDVDIIGRLGGDEFGVLVVDAITENGSAILSRLEENLNRLNEGNDLYRLSLSIGLIEIDLNNSETIYELIGKADAAMYKRKRKKRRRRSQSNRFPCPEEYCEEFGRVKTPEYLNAV